ncbi:uncharacterized protein P174DRAFT_481370 [Aspergillus novofumigatus IBT 16806]|uniref:Uncharacterized protein n=1 Tax=Aspergillus novofumigatus (strain IBT 16806) TaxID=1392255 RepID=A0A2I1CCT9_ASPN1|nr:uncharacterized protein P174DRAFT_481370 [Aspergillus novofumigatus IBT 16806]PKX95439.1 hypothetical protein P174DRAFT_481370 [Aspergillus novofumigatus IBT 16806]
MSLRLGFHHGNDLRFMIPSCTLRLHANNDIANASLAQSSDVPIYMRNDFDDQLLEMCRAPFGGSKSHPRGSRFRVTDSIENKHRYSKVIYTLRRALKSSGDLVMDARNSLSAGFIRTGRICMHLLMWIFGLAVLQKVASPDPIDQNISGNSKYSQRFMHTRPPSTSAFI